MQNPDLFKALTVRVNNGSGVLLTPLSEKVMYIVTASHVLNGGGGEQENRVISFKQESGLENVTPDVKRVICCEEHDAAIIIIDRIDAITNFVCPVKNGLNGMKWHIGYPNDQNNRGEAKRCVMHEIRHWHGKYEGVFEEYQCEDSVDKNELEGMSGGGIFNDRGFLLGVHKSQTAKENKEQLGKCVMVPWWCFEKMINENELPPVMPFDLRNFAPFKDKFFDFSDNKAAEEKLDQLLAELFKHKNHLAEVSPLNVYMSFQENRQVSSPVDPVLLCEADWVRFGEFLLVMKAVEGYDVKERLDELFKDWQYVHSDEDFDFYEISKKIDQSLLGVVEKQLVFVVGGLSSKGYDQDVKTKKIPDLSTAIEYNSGFDVAHADRRSLGCFTFVNCCLFKDAMAYNTTAISKYDGNKIEIYKQLIHRQIDENN